MGSDAAAKRGDAVSVVSVVTLDPALGLVGLTDADGSGASGAAFCTANFWTGLAADVVAAMAGPAVVTA